MSKLSIQEINLKLNSIEGWSFSDNSIQRNFVVNNFSEAIAFVVKVGIESEKLDHHPDLLLHQWNKVKVTLSTHSVGGVTENDFKLALKINEVL